MRKKFQLKKIFNITDELNKKLKELSKKKKRDEAEIIREQIEKACWENNIN